ncbi:MAG: TetR/AcrR family transcriptional regulator [Hyphomicrobiales bacterium]
MRDRILEAAADLFFEKGLDGTSMRDIAAAVGLVPSSLYNHFPTRDSLITAVMERSFELVDGTVRGLFDEPPSVGLLRRVLEAHALQHVHGIKETMVFEFEGRHMPEAVRNRVVELRHIYERRFYDLADRLAEMGLVTRDETRTRMRLLLSAGGKIGDWFQPGGRFTEEEVAAIYAQFGLASLDVDPNLRQPLSPK